MHPRSTAPIKLGVLLDFVLPPPDGWDSKRDILDALRLTFADAVAAGRLDPPGGARGA